METLEKIFAAKLLKVKAIKLQPTNPFTWASGWKSPFYCDNRKTLSYPDLRSFVKIEISRLVAENFADADGLQLMAGQDVQQCILRRQQRKVAAVCGAGKAAALFTDKRTGDDAPNAMFSLHDFPGNLTDSIQLVQRNLLLMGCDLQHTVSRGIDDQIAGAQMLLSVVLNDLRARIGQIAEDTASGTAG